ncbi:3-phosphoshikimate 1-carboxyvinyltransferase [Polluticaenibacter yanchengensis]|uniref:3-phosphoshikimate 1-carboxyvinyltransferase n=1 Tax=Polluticaenibacter yanchengensis TaxID=3014562 RepID=A0ABT4UM21_9BACT|nr:3-phosphoshikimate 1-carboxyvinyltransferase [Chitinophagaceae bacterium LY-5]
MNVSVQPSAISGRIHANASKSAMQRACAAALVKPGKSIISNPGISNDDKAALDIIEKLGAKITQLADGSISVEGAGNKIIPNGIDNTIHCGESGLSIRMFTPIASLSEQQVNITGEGSLLVRPMDFFDGILPQLKVTVQSNEGKLPLSVSGPLIPQNITIDGSLSSQFLTGLLMAYSAADASDVTITVIDLKSKPYIDLTLQLLKEFGLKEPVNNNYESFYFPATATDATQTVEYSVEGDWSGAAFILVAGAVAGSVQLDGIYANSRQADKKIIDAIVDAGAKVKVSPSSVTVEKDRLLAFNFDATDCPDLFPPLVALAANCKGTTRILGLKRLKYKESDRGITLQEEFAKFGISIELNDDVMLVHGTGKISVKNHTMNSHHDHRIAMAAAVGALTADFEISIRNADAINKSYPEFYKHIAALGAKVEEA